MNHYAWNVVVFVVAMAGAVACGDKDDTGGECAAGTASCSGDVLTECVDGTVVETDCAADGMICHDMGDDSHCMMDGEMEM